MTVRAPGSASRPAKGDRAPRREMALNERALPPRERLLSVFADQDSESLRGCPFHNAAVETAGRLPAVQAAVARHKQRHKHEFTQRLIEAAAEAGAADPQALGR